MIDVQIDVYGKPYQTIATLMSLKKHSGRHIGRVFMTVEKEVPWGDNMTPLWDYIREQKIEVHVPSKHEPYRSDAQDRKSVKYQFGIDESREDYIFMCHNDIKFTGDILGEMITCIGDRAGIGLIGQCWNCSAHYAGRCDGHRMETTQFDYHEMIQMVRDFPAPRVYERHISKPVMPLPECRLNEFACLMDRKLLVKKSNEGLFYGLYDGNDLGQRWFREMVLQGYKFHHYDIGKMSQHCYWAQDCGFSATKNEELYYMAEKRAYEDTVADI